MNSDSHSMQVLEGNREVPSTMKTELINRIAVATLLSAAICLTSCTEGSFGSDVGKNENISPIANAQVLNSGELGSNEFREGSEVILSSKNSEDGDGPLVEHRWVQSGGPTVQLVEVNRTTVSFTAPDVASSTPLEFALTVEDSDGATASSNVSVTVVPAQDADRFLSLDITGMNQASFDTFKVIAALGDGGAPGTNPEPFDISVKAYLVYPQRNVPNPDCTVDLASFAMSIPDQTAGGCFVSMLEDLTPNALVSDPTRTGIDGQWPANAPVPPVGSGQDVNDLISAWWNPRYTIDIPRLDIADFNQQFVDSGNRDRILDRADIDQARIYLQLNLNAPNRQSFADLILISTNDDAVTVPSDGVVTKSGGNWLIAGKAHFANTGNGMITSGVVPLESVLGAIPGRESALTAAVYYRTVDPNSTRTTLNDWLFQAGFASDRNGSLLPEAEAGTGEFSHAVYLNNFDLGFGRDMYMRRDSNGNLFSFVVNYATLEGAIRRIDPIVTVVMEYSPLGDDLTDPNKFTKFFTYAEDGTGDQVRISSMNFDGRGERFTPGNCVVCHGGLKPPGLSDLEFPNQSCSDASNPACYDWPTGPNADRMLGASTVSIENGNLHATFLPWDLESFLFADTDPAIVESPPQQYGTNLSEDLLSQFGDFSMASQEEQIRRLNEAVYSIYCEAEGCPTYAARVLVGEWYDTENGEFTSEFDDSTPPPGWGEGDVVDNPSFDPINPVEPPELTNPASAEDVYQNVFAQHCRMCHINISEETLRFDNYQKFLAQSTRVETSVFHNGTMPFARLTYDRMWVGNDGAAIQALADELGVAQEVVDSGPSPVARITMGPSTAVARGDSVILSSSMSTFANSQSWNLVFTPPPELAENPTYQSFSPGLVGAESVDMSFGAVLAGSYEVTLTINEDTAPVSDTLAVEVQNHAPNAPPFSLTIDEASTGQFVLLDNLIAGCPAGDPMCVLVFGDPDATTELDTSGWNNALYGTLNVTDASTGAFTIDANVPGPIQQSIPYTITDVDGESSSNVVDITIQALAAPVVSNDPRSMQAQTTVAPTASGRSTTIDVLMNDTAAAGFDLQVNSFTQPANGTVTQSGNSLVYRPNLGFVGVDTFLYDAIDDSPGMRVSETMATVSVTVQATTPFTPNVQSAFANCAGAGCHGGTERDWTDHSEITKSDPGVTNVISSPTDARNSLILTHPNSGAHGGGPQPMWNEADSADFRTVLRWIEEGAQNN